MSTETFAAKLTLVLKILIMSRAQLAAEVGVDKSVAGRWAAGAVEPSAHNLARLTAVIARRAPGFTSLDWDRDLAAIAAKLGAEADAEAPAEPPSLPLSCLPRAYATTRLRGRAYEGFFRSTRLSGRHGDRYMHDYSMVRMDENGLLRITMVTAGVRTDAWLLPLHNQLYCVGNELSTDTPVFGIFHATGSLVADVLDGLILTSVHDPARTPTASPVIFHRIGDLTGDAEQDRVFLEALGERESSSAPDQVPQALREHLCRDIGPAAAALGGDALMQAPLSRSLTT